MKNLSLIFINIILLGVLTLGEVQAYSNEVYQAQVKLSNLGYNPGPSDGLWGKNTSSAIKRFQSAQGLSITGRLDQKTKRKLGISWAKSLTFSFEGIHKIEGFITTVRYYGPPNWGDTPEEDTLLTAYILQLQNPISVVNNDKNSDNETTTTTEVQLVAYDFLKQITKASKRHKKVRIKGEFFSSHTGYHIRKILMDVKGFEIVK